MHPYDVVGRKLLAAERASWLQVSFARRASSERRYDDQDARNSSSVWPAAYAGDTKAAALETSTSSACRARPA
jgi:hypothetical protein